jgi:hypothetical protein
MARASTRLLAGPRSAHGRRKDAVAVESPAEFFKVDAVTDASQAEACATN